MNHYRSHVIDHAIPVQGHPRTVDTRFRPFLTSDMEGEELQIPDKQVFRQCVSLTFSRRFCKSEIIYSTD